MTENQENTSSNNPSIANIFLAITISWLGFFLTLFTCYMFGLAAILAGAISLAAGILTAIVYCLCQR